MSLDSKADPDKNRWSDWLHLGNLFQHLGQAAVIATSATFEPSETQVVVAAAPSESKYEDLLQDIFDPAALSLARAAAAAGHAGFVVGYAGDADDTPIEVAWPTAKVGILPSGGTEPSGHADWVLQTPDQWDEASLLAALEGGG